MRNKKRSFRNSILIHSKNEIKHQKDFDWRPRKRNPYAKQEGIDWGWRIKLAAISASFLGMFSLFLYHPFFHIQKFEISGLQRINENELREALEGTMNYRKFFILPARSYLMVDSEDVADIIMSRFPIESIIIKKKFPQKMAVVINEKISTVIYDNGKEYSYLGLEGKIVEKIRKVGEGEWTVVTETVTTTLADGIVHSEEKEIERYHLPSVKNIIIEMGNYPIVYDMRGQEGSINDPALKPETVAGIIAWFNKLERQTDVPFGYLILDTELGDAEIKTREGWGIRVNLLERIEDQFEDMQYILREKATRSNLSYIDLRYQDKVYWK